MSVATASFMGDSSTIARTGASALTTAEPYVPGRCLSPSVTSGSQSRALLASIWPEQPGQGSIDPVWSRTSSVASSAESLGFMTWIRVVRRSIVCWLR